MARPIAHLVLSPEVSSGGLAAVRDATLAAEGGLFDAVIAPPPSAALPAEPSTLLAALAAVTTRIGLIARVSTKHIAPYNQARYLATLDHLSKGRAGWILPADEWDARTGEFVSVLRQLWESWAPDAVRADTEAGVYVDSALLQPIRHTGPHFSVLGPLNLPRSPQLHPPLIAAIDGADIAVITAGVERPLGVPLVLRDVRPVLDDPRALADDLTAQISAGAVDGFVINLPAEAVAGFIRDVVPRLQDSGVFRTRYESATLRGHLGLPALTTLTTSAAGAHA